MEEISVFFYCVVYEVDVARDFSRGTWILFLLVLSTQSKGFSILIRDLLFKNYFKVSFLILKKKIKLFVNHKSHRCLTSNLFMFSQYYKPIKEDFIVETVDIMW